MRFFLSRFCLFMMVIFVNSAFFSLFFENKALKTSVVS